MDPLVIQAMQRWPAIPAAYGWLSLDARGAWRLHEHGDANTGLPGEPIAHLGLREFINRNYAADALGRWFFQNGPQRVYVTLAAAPYVLRWNDTQTGLCAHTGQAAGTMLAWWLASDGRLYAQTDIGPALIDDRDLAQTVQRLRLDDGRSLLEAWDEAASLPAAEAMPQREPVTLRLDGLGTPAPLWRAGVAQLGAALHFIARPQPPGA